MWTPRRIRKLRLNLDITQRELGVLMGYSAKGAAPQVSDMERGQRAVTGITSRLLDFIDILKDYDLIDAFIDEDNGLR